MLLLMMLLEFPLLIRAGFRWPASRRRIPEAMSLASVMQSAGYVGVSAGRDLVVTNQPIVLIVF